MQAGLVAGFRLAVQMLVDRRLCSPSNTRGVTRAGFTCVLQPGLHVTVDRQLSCLFPLGLSSRQSNQLGVEIELLPADFRSSFLRAPVQ